MGSGRTLLKNATVWSWISGPETGHCSGEALPGKEIVIERGRITIIRNNTDSVTNYNDFDLVVDLNHRLVLPGLIDSHIHVAMLGESQHYVNLDDCFSIESVQQKVRECAEREPDLPFVVGFSWDQTKIGRLPTREDLDSLNIHKPIFLWRACWHIAVCNTQALRLAGFLPLAEGADFIRSLSGGAIDLFDAGDSLSLTGVLRERAVEPVVKALATYKTAEHTRRFIEEGLRLCVHSGLTSVQTNDEGCLSVYLSLLSEGESLPLRVMLTPVQAELEQSLLGAIDGAPLRCFKDAHTDADTPASRLCVERVKIFSDGSLGAETAALLLDEAQTDGDKLSPSLSPPPHKGMLIHETGDLVRMICLARERGFRVEIHAIGDAAAAQVLGAMSLASESGALVRPLLTHCQVLHPTLIERMRELGVIANVQASFVPTDMRWVMNRLSPAQIESAYAWKTLMYSGVHVAGGSDAPIESPSPLLGLHDAIFRTNARKSGVKAEDVAVFRADQCLSFAEALWTYTVEGAYAAGYEHSLGRVKEGYAADLVVVDPLCLSDHESLFALRPDLVMVGGAVQVFHNNADKGIAVVKGDVSLALSGSAKGESDEAPSHSEGDKAFVPGKGGDVGACKVIGFCMCFLRQQSQNMQFCF